MHLWKSTYFLKYRNFIEINSNITNKIVFAIQFLNNKMPSDFFKFNLNFVMFCRLQEISFHMPPADRGQFSLHYFGLFCRFSASFRALRPRPPSHTFQLFCPPSCSTFCQFSHFRPDFGHRIRSTAMHLLANLVGI